MKNDKSNIVNIDPKKHLVGLDEIYCNFYKCPKCKFDYIMRSHKYCPNCGRQLIWCEPKK